MATTPPATPAGGAPASGSTPAPAGNNPGGDNGAPPADSNTQNNTGDTFDPVSFWDDGGEPGGDLPSQPSDRSAESQSSPPPSPNPGSPPPATNAFAQQLMGQIDGMQFDDVFNDTVTAAINTGDYAAANTAIAGNLRETIRRGVQVQAGILREFSKDFRTRLMSEVEGMVGSQFTGRDQHAALVKAIPSAANPKVGPAVQAVYQQALKKTSNDVPKAIAMTRSMMATLAAEMAGDVDLVTAPRDPHAPAPAPSTNWLEELSRA